MRTAQISFQNKKVLIIGGGKQGILRAKQFLEEGAQVIIVTPSISKELCCLLYEYRDELDENGEARDSGYLGKLHCIEKEYQEKLIENAFLIFACTADRELNHQIVLDANEKGMLSASVHKDSEASYHPLRFRDYPNLHVAMSTNGAFPSYLDTILEEIEASYHNHHHNELEELRGWRAQVLQREENQDVRKALLQDWKARNKINV